VREHRATRQLNIPSAAPTPRSHRRIPPTALVLGAIVSVQTGAAVAKSLFDDAGPAGTVLLRVAFAALVLWLLWRPRPAGLAPADLRLAALFGLTLAAMNLAFYEALDRIPLGVAVTLEFVGPLGVAVAASRRLLDGLWVALAAGGILLLADLSGGSVSAAGVALALLAGCFWAAYILVNERVGRAFAGGSGLALAMAVATVLLLPVGVAGAGDALLDPRVLAIGAAVAMLSSAIPYSLELEALRRIPAGVFGVLMSLEPAVAALAGLVILGEVLEAREWTGIALIVGASAGAARGARVPRPVEG
jgi:inner membrane transporter RhtA